ncbi:MAG: sigma-70 family RNA polymerase sigma factor [Bacteroidaceae bacterium]|nr:sigma-70 family RNA polymerase sigma factor [Bacteroidaceae bacterium]
MEHTEFASLAPILRSKAKAVGMSFFASEEQAEDIAQETVISLWKAWGTLSSKEEAERLVVKVAKHECIDVWRREQRRPHTSLTISHEQAHPASSEAQTLEESELAEAIRNAASTLRKSEQRLWRMFAEAEMQPREIAIVTGINVRTVSSMLSHARHHIYNVLKEGGFIDE